MSIAPRPATIPLGFCSFCHGSQWEYHDTLLIFDLESPAHEEIIIRCRECNNVKQTTSPIAFRLRYMKGAMLFAIHRANLRASHQLGGAAEKRAISTTF